jgi:hypothetical protein
MKVQAYITDCCNELKRAKDVVGLSSQPDIIDKFESFKTIANPEKADIHYCIICYTKYVTNVVAQITNRQKDETEYNYLMKVHAYSFKMMVINTFNHKKRV